jgi:hypothetical protein
MKRYLIFAAMGPLLGGFWLLLTTTYQSGYWDQTNVAEVAKLFKVFAMTLQYSYLFGILPSLMIGAVDDILVHVKRIGPVLRMLLVGIAAFFAAAFLYSSRGSDSGAVQFILSGLVGFIPGTISSWLVHTFVEEPQPAAPADASATSPRRIFEEPPRYSNPVKRDYRPLPRHSPPGPM